MGCTTLISRRTLSRLAACFLCAATLSAIKPDVLQSTRRARARRRPFSRGRRLQQSASGQYFVFDRRGHTVQFHGAGIVAPNSLFFGRQGRLIATQGLSEFDVP